MTAQLSPLGLGTPFANFRRRPEDSQQRSSIHLRPGILVNGDRLETLEWDDRLGLEEVAIHGVKCGRRARAASHEDCSHKVTVPVDQTFAKIFGLHIGRILLSPYLGVAQSTEPLCLLHP